MSGSEVDRLMKDIYDTPADLVAKRAARFRLRNHSPEHAHENLDRPHPHHAHRQPAAAEAADGPDP